MGYFEFHYEEKDDQRVAKLARSLRLSIPYALGHLALLRAWAATDKFRAFTGDLSGYPPEVLAEAAKLPENAPPAVDWVKALLDSELLIRDPAAPDLALGEPLGGHAILADWLEICGEAVKRRIERRTASDSVGQNGDNIDSLLSLSVSGSRSVSPVWSVFMVYKYIKKNKNKKELSDARWDAINKGMSLPWCKKILDAYEGDTKKAAQALLEIGDYFDRASLTWNPSTVYKRLTDWEEGRLAR